MKKRIYVLMMIAFITIQAFAQPKSDTGIIEIKNLGIYENNSELIINWATNGTVATNYWKVQRSTNKVQFSTIALVLGNDPSQQGDQYIYTEKLKDTKRIKYYYRLCHVSANGDEIISDILTPAK